MNFLYALWYPEKNEVFEFHPYISTSEVDYLIFKITATL